MGGIFGIIAENRPETIETGIERMTACLVFRGSVKKECSLAHRGALGTVSHEWYPNDSDLYKESSNGIACVFEGEIYNSFPEDRDDGSPACGVRTDPAAEMVNKYKGGGFDFCRYCNGVYVFALYDTALRTLILARDHLGSHSLYYGVSGNTVVFASTVDAIIASKLIKKDLDREALNLYFSGTCVPHPYTMFRQIRCVPPGQMVIFHNGAVRCHDYWRPYEISEDRTTQPQDFRRQIRDLVNDAISIRLQPDLHFGCVLSGGVDSSTITATLQRRVGRFVPTFSIGYHEMEYDDTPLQEIMKQRFDLQPYTARITAEEIPDLLQAVVRHCDGPLNNASAMGTYKCFNLASGRVRAVFEGEAADELFCGGGGVVGENFIEHFDCISLPLRRALFAPFGRHMAIDGQGRASKLKRFLHRLSLPQHDRMLTWLPGFDQAARLKLFHHDLHPTILEHDVLANGRAYLDASRMKDPINRYQYGACKTYLCNDLLYKNERMAAANGVINRTPFIDYRLAELAFRIPARYKLTGVRAARVEKKLIFRQALQGVIPDEILWRRKTRGFSQPTAIWMRGPLRSFVTDVLLDRRTRERGLFNMDYVNRLLRLHFDGRVDLDRLLWGLLTFELWMRCHYDA